DQIVGSGFSSTELRNKAHSLLTKSVDSGESYEDILAEYKGQIGLEGRTVLKAMVLNREAGKLR
ncbi:hypothetical protein AB6E39_26090, partial [Vibrio splendidus]|uniref:hypothetical protein n=1 Tax=Vibrio splendidus TaxID=29497 RepID=UPI00354B3521|nr:hypothetical protein [Vibrio splendidus]